MKGKIVKTDKGWCVEIQSDVHGYGIGWGDPMIYPLFITDENIWEGKEVEVEALNYDSNFLPVIVKIKETTNQCFIDNDMSDYVGFINFLRREIGMSKTRTLIALEQCKQDVANILIDWNKSQGKKTSTLKNEDGKPFVNTMPMIETNKRTDGLCDAKSIYGSELNKIRELTLDERMHIWFVEHKPNRDVCDSVDEMNDVDKAKYLDECGIPKTTENK